MIQMFWKSFCLANNFDFLAVLAIGYLEFVTGHIGKSEPIWFALRVLLTMFKLRVFFRIKGGDYEFMFAVGE